jgi:hypothetical protein
MVMLAVVITVYSDQSISIGQWANRPGTKETANAKLGIQPSGKIKLKTTD